MTPRRGSVANSGAGDRGVGVGRIERLRGDTENLVNESDLPCNVTLGQPFHLPLSDHVHRLVTGDCVQRSFDRSEPQARGNSLFDESMVLLHYVI